MTDLQIQYDDTGEPCIILGENKLKLEREEISGMYVEKARKELRETPEIVEKSLCELTQLLEERGFRLPDDEKTRRAFLIKYLRPCKFYPKSTLKMMYKFYHFKEKNPKFSENLLPATAEKIFIDSVITFPPVRMPDGSRILILNIENWKPKEANVNVLIRGFLLALEIAMGEPKTQVSGVQVIINLQGLSLSHIAQFNPMIAKMILSTVQECLPLRLKGVHVINQFSIFKLAYAIFKPFIWEKMRKRLHFHGTDYDSLKRFIPADCLPVKWGGTVEEYEYPGILLYKIMKYFEYEYEELLTYGFYKEKIID